MASWPLGADRCAETLFASASPIFSQSLPSAKTNSMAEQKITAEQVVHVAKLGRLELSDEQRRKFAAQLERILEYVAKISQDDVSGVQTIANAYTTHYGVYE